MQLRRLDAKTDGSEEKYWCIDLDTYDKYLVKFQKKDWENVKCEHIASKFINLLGINSHKTILIKTNIGRESTGETRLAVACKDFTQEYGELKTFKENTDSMSTNRFNYKYSFNDILHVLFETHKIDDMQVLKDFWNMYICDLILANPDRHWGNWGICKNKYGRQLSPTFDNRASLLPRAKFKSDTTNCTEEEWWYTRIYEFPNSKILFESGIRERSSYIDVWNSKLIPIGLKQIYYDGWNNGIIQDILYNQLFQDEIYITIDEALFIIKYIELRYRGIIMGEDFQSAYLNTQENIAILYEQWQ